MTGNLLPPSPDDAPNLRDMDAETLKKFYPPNMELVPEGPAPPLPDGVSDIRDLDVETLIELYPPKEGPIEDNIIQLPAWARFLSLLIQCLEATDSDAIVFGNSWLYYSDERGGISRVAPDAYVAFGASRERLNADESYFVDRMGKPPVFVLEIASPSTVEQDVNDKRRIYAQIGICEYWMFDPKGGDLYGFPLMGLRLVNGEYAPIGLIELADGRVIGRSEALGLTLFYEDGELHVISLATFPTG